jgi:hypothetical protein
MNKRIKLEFVDGASLEKDASRQVVLHVPLGINSEFVYVRFIRPFSSRVTCRDMKLARLRKSSIQRKRHEGRYFVVTTVDLSKEAISALRRLLNRNFAEDGSRILSEQRRKR